MQAVFHLAYPVKSLEETKAFFVKAFESKIGRVREDWLDLYFFGHQITLHQKPEEVPAHHERGVNHMGAVLAWDDWLAFGESLKQKGVLPEKEPEIKYAGEPKQQGKIFLRDPNGYLIEIKAYKNPDIALEIT